MIDLHQLRTLDKKILFLGSHPGIIQSILDFDYLAGETAPRIQAIISGGKRSERYFWGKKEILIPVFPDISSLSTALKSSLTLCAVVTSARRVLAGVTEATELLPELKGVVVFAEDVPERHALELAKLSQERNLMIVGPASVGLLLPGLLKLGAIGGVDYRQLVSSKLFSPGSVAVFAASGGMTNEIISLVTGKGKRLSFALHFGGDRFPVTTPEQAFLAAEADPQTKTIVYYGELGGVDEYAIAKLLQEKKLSKPIICYIAGVISELFETPPQFGHAKAMAATSLETARSKRDALRSAGAQVAESFTEFVQLIEAIAEASQEVEDAASSRVSDLQKRKKGLFLTTISSDREGDAHVLGQELLSFAKEHSFAYTVISMFLGQRIISKELESFVDLVLRLLVDHGPYVSGAVNTMVTARAGRDLVSSLASGILTIGPRFGGAINEAAANWLRGVREGKEPAAFVEEFAKNKTYILGIGHKKYRLDLPDPRVTELLAFTDSLSEKKYTSFALSVQKVTTAKKGNLILNIDGAIAAVLLDLLCEKEKLTEEQLDRLVKTEFFNALFVLSRSVGFIAHFLDQKRLDEGLFRLPEDMVSEIESFE